MDYGAYVITGIQGSGKTAFMTYTVIDQFVKTNRTIICNYEIKGIKSLQLSFKTLMLMIKDNAFPDTILDPKLYQSNLDKHLANPKSTKKMEDIVLESTVAFRYYVKKRLGIYPSTVDNLLKNSVIAMDEFHLAVHAYDFLKKDSRILTGFMSQLRKRGVLLLYTTQHYRKIAIEARRETYFGFQMVKKEEYSKNVFGYIYTDLVDHQEIKIDFVDFTEFFKKKSYDTSYVIH